MSKVRSLPPCVGITRPDALVAFPSPSSNSFTYSPTSSLFPLLPPVLPASHFSTSPLSSQPGGLVNGSRGVIVDWVDRNDVPLDAEDDERNMPGPTQKGGPKGGAFGGEEWRMKAAEEWADKQGEPVYPVVYFATGKQRALPPSQSAVLSSSDLSRCAPPVIIKPHSWCIDIDKDNTVARTQLPLQLAWFVSSPSCLPRRRLALTRFPTYSCRALTIHKSQGQSLDAVGVRLTSTFEKGQ